MRQLVALLKTMRPKQWIKNALIFAALVFDVKFLNPVYLLRTAAGFALFCMISGVVYTINDIVDLEKDRQHPSKRDRPLPSGALKRPVAIAAVIVIGLGCVALAFLLNLPFALILTGYLVLQLAYSFLLKHIVLLDVLAIAAGFLLRVVAGIPLVEAERFSPWLYLCMTLVALFLALSKRRGELILLEKDAANHRKTLGEYNIYLLDQLISVVTGSTLLAYSLYTISAPNLPANHTMMLTIPFVIYGLFRYLYLIHARGCTQAPDEVLLSDRPLQVTVVFWGLVAAGILYLG